MNTHGHTHGIIDVHCHVVPLDLPHDPTGGKLQLWPRMSCDGGHAASFVAGAVTRKFDDRSWLASRRIDYMDQNGIELQVLSPLPELLAYWFPADATALMCRHTNDAMAKIIEQHPTRFNALGGIPMNDIDLAIAEARRIKALGFAGVEVGSNVNGISPADPRFAPILQALHELDLSVFVHGVRPAVEGRVPIPELMGPIVGVPLDTALCVASFIVEGVLQRLPHLRVGFSHGGGGIGAVIDRLQHIWTVMPDFKSRLASSPLQEARRFFYDILTFSPEYIAFLLKKFGSQCLFVGTDFPAGGMGLMDPNGFLKSLELPAEQLADITRNTALRFLKKG